MKDLYRVRDTRLQDLKNQGYSYQGTILANVLSSHLFENPVNAGFLSQLENIVTKNVEDIKYIKKLYCFSLNKKSNDII